MVRSGLGSLEEGKACQGHIPGQPTDQEEEDVGFQDLALRATRTLIGSRQQEP